MTDQDSTKAVPYDATLPSEDRVDSLLVDYTHGRVVGLVDIDGEPDRRFDMALLDINGDGKVDVWIRRLEDGGFEVSFDTDGDSEPDTSELWTRPQLCNALPHLVDLLDLRWEPEDTSELHPGGTGITNVDG
jgi:hypothetical protein